MGFEYSALCVDIKESDVNLLGDLIGDNDTARNMIKLAYYIPNIWVVTKQIEPGIAGIKYLADDNELIHGRN